MLNRIMGDGILKKLLDETNINQLATMYRVQSSGTTVADHQVTRGFSEIMSQRLVF